MAAVLTPSQPHLILNTSIVLYRTILSTVSKQVWMFHAAVALAHHISLSFSTISAQQRLPLCLHPVAVRASPRYINHRCGVFLPISTDTDTDTVPAVPRNTTSETHTPCTRSSCQARAAFVRFLWGHLAVQHPPPFSDMRRCMYRCMTLQTLSPTPHRKPLPHRCRPAAQDRDRSVVRVRCDGHGRRLTAASARQQFRSYLRGTRVRFAATCRGPLDRQAAPRSAAPSRRRMFDWHRVRSPPRTRAKACAAKRTERRLRGNGAEAGGVDSPR